MWQQPSLLSRRLGPPLLDALGCLDRLRGEEGWGKALLLRNGVVAFTQAARIRRNVRFLEGLSCTRWAAPLCGCPDLRLFCFQVVVFAWSMPAFAFRLLHLMPSVRPHGTHPGMHPLSSAKQGGSLGCLCQAPAPHA